MPDTPYPTIDEAISYAEEIGAFSLDGDNPDNGNTTRYHLLNGPAVISSALIGVHVEQLPSGMRELLEEDSTLASIMPETKEAYAGNLNIELRKAVYNDPEKVLPLVYELIESLEEFKNTPSQTTTE